MKFPFETLDVFTETRYQGNPLAIVAVPTDLRASLKQKHKQAIAKEFNFSETVFLHLEGATDEIPIDIFTPQQELPFAGHPTIGSAHYLLKMKGLNVKALRTKAGSIPVAIDNASGYVRAEIPHNIHIHRAQATSELTSDAIPYVSIVRGMTFLLVPLPTVEVLAKATSRIAGSGPTTVLDEGWQEGFVGTYYYVPQGGDDKGRTKLRVRMQGSREDPATGSAASALTSYLALQEPQQKGAGPFRFALTQGVEMGSPSEIFVEILEQKGVMESRRYF